MKRAVFTLIFVLLSILSFAQESNNYAEDQLIIQFKSNSGFEVNTVLSQQKFGIFILDSLNGLFQVERIELTGNKKKRNAYILRFKTEQNIDQLLKIYQNTELFEFVEPNFIGSGGGKQGSAQTAPNDTYFSRQYGLYNDGTFLLSPALNDADIDMDLGWDIEKGDSSIIVAVLDAGLKMDHPEFAGRLWTNALETPNGIDDDNNGLVDDIEGWNFAYVNNDPSDDHGHGTNVAGIIGANGNNNLGYAGVDWNCKVMVCKILDSNNNGFYSWWTDAIYYAVDNGVKVINMSVGGSSFSTNMEQAVDYAYNNGVTIVACMMNFDNAVTHYPAGYQNTIAVGATDASDERASPFFWSTSSGSCYGSHIDVVAPGNYIYGLSYTSNTNYNSYWGGTSQATPLVTGLSALLIAQDPNRSPTDIRAILRNTAEDQVGDATEDILGFDIYYGYGRINAHQALLNTGIHINEFSASELSIFPNPSSEFLLIHGEMEYSNISITNMLGSEVFRKSIIANSSELEIDISDLPKGMYMVHISNKERKLIVFKKIIKN